MVKKYVLDFNIISDINVQKFSKKGSKREENRIQVNIKKEEANTEEQGLSEEKIFPKIHQIARKCSKIQANSKNSADRQAPQTPLSFLRYVLLSYALIL